MKTCLTASFVDKEDVDLYTSVVEFFEIAGCDAQLSRVRLKKKKKFYEHSLLEVDCYINNEVQESYFNFCEGISFAKKWCELGELEKFRGHLQWLNFQATGHSLGMHPRDTNVRLHLLSFGTFPELSVFGEHLCFDSDSCDAHADFFHDDLRFHIYLTLMHKEECSSNESTYQLSVRYKDIQKIIVKYSDSPDFFFKLKSPPLLSKKFSHKDVKSDDCGGSTSDDSKENSNFFVRVWECECTCLKKLFPKDIRGKCLVLRLKLDNIHIGLRLLMRILRRCGSEFYFSPIIIKKIDDGEVERILLKCEKLLDYIPYECAYALKSIINVSYDVVDQIILSGTDWRVYQEWLKKLCEKPTAFSKTFHTLFEAIDHGNVIVFQMDVAELFSRFSLCPEEMDELPNGTCLVRRVFFTPSRTLMLPPRVQLQNRVVREYGAEYGLRVSFRDDDLEKLRVNRHRCCDKLLDDFVGTILRHGFVVGFREFQYLAASTSQLRDHGLWFYADYNEKITVKEIRRWMGMFENISNVAKLMARMGQCLSSTESSVRVPLHNKRIVKTIDDIETLDKRYIFSDGIGRISSALMERVCAQLKLNDPSAIQIRYAGYKGMLCVDPDLQGECLHLRKSMQKFDCHEIDDLEVIKASAPRAVSLNRQLITLLDQLETPDSVFMDLQSEMILEYIDGLVSEEKAVELLSNFSRVSFPLKQLAENGLPFTKEPFFRSLLQTIMKYSLDGLRYRTRISIPVHLGRNMYGVLDERDCLQYGQIFVQISDMSKDSSVQKAATKVITGKVIVTKCPCVHPGDVRILEAVDRPALYHIKDCVVFPAKGPRPHTDEIAGSDLDGDEYIVIWDQRLIFPKGNRKPMIFQPKRSDVKGGGIQDEDVINFLCNVIKYDSTGRLSNAHMAWADQEPHGIFSSTCLDIAKKISLCIDFVKTGGIPSFMKGFKSPRLYPDFMEKGALNTTYRSERVLGKLYRACRSIEALMKMTVVRSDECEPLFFISGWEEYGESALASLKVYNAHMSKVLQQTGLHSEAELVTCMLLNGGKYHKDMTQNERTSLEDLVEKHMTFMLNTARDEFFNELDVECRNARCSPEEKDRRKLKRASAWYMVTQRENKHYSFPWSISDVLSEILERHPMPKENNFLADEINKRVPTERSNLIELTSFIFKEWLAKEGLEDLDEYIQLAFLRYIKERCLADVGDADQLEIETCDILHLCTNFQVKNEIASLGALSVYFLRYLIDQANLSYIPEHIRQQLSLAALKTYGALAITRDLGYLGLSSEVTREQVDLFSESTVRVQVKSDWVEEKLEAIQLQLRNWFSLRELYCRFERKSLIINIVGKDIERWVAEDFLLRPNLEDALKAGSKDVLVSSTKRNS